MKEGNTMPLSPYSESTVIDCSLKSIKDPLSLRSTLLSLYIYESFPVYLLHRNYTVIHKIISFLFFSVPLFSTSFNFFKFGKKKKKKNLFKIGPYIFPIKTSFKFGYFQMHIPSKNKVLNLPFSHIYLPTKIGFNLSHKLD